MVPAAPFPEAAAHTMSLIASKLQQPLFSSALANWQMTQPGENVNQLLKMPEILTAAREKWVVIELKTLRLLSSVTAKDMADLQFLPAKLATTLTPKSTTKDDALELNHAPVAGNTLHMCTNVSSSSLYTIHNW
ncbi:unnamed protein product [Sphagnum jensenii]|uniref:Uncharacterized protein n=1 Tax=Sphagnum jensenii TaxID=128206 RepID=A0ABP1ARA2_9BRYO